MAEETPIMEENTKAEAKTFTQEDVNRIVAERVQRVKAQVPADYEELKAKAAAFDEAEDAKKSELEKAQEAANEWKSKYEAMERDNKRRAEVAAAAKEFDVDAGLLERMSGNIEENAKLLSEALSHAPKYPSVKDNGEPAGSKAQAPRAIPTVF